MHRFLLVFCMTLAAMMGLLLTLFFMFHFWLMLRATTTIEFCEKTYRHTGCSHRGSKKSIYDRELFSNVKEVLGPNVFTWFLPIAPPAGDGVSFKVSKDIEPDDESDTETSALLPRSIGASNKGRGSVGSTDTTLSRSESSADDLSKPVGTPPEITGASQPIS